MRNDLLLILAPSDVMQAAKEKEAAYKEAEQPSEHFVSALSQHIIPKWQAAQQAKIIPEMEMLASVRQKRGEYDPQKLAEIQNVGQPEIFMNVTDTKVRNGVAWIKDIIIQPTQRIIAVDPTPLPDLPQDIKERSPVPLSGSILKWLFLRRRRQGNKYL